MAGEKLSAKCMVKSLTVGEDKHGCIMQNA